MGTGSTSRRICPRCFFQAEDGIRDGHVTGVQTCALPISLPASTCRTPSWHSCTVSSATRPAGGRNRSAARQIGRASCRERGKIVGGAAARKREEGRGQRLAEVEDSGAAGGARHALSLHEG